MKKININLSKAQITKYTVELKEESPSVTVTIGLFTEAGKQITEYNISTESWYGDKKFDLPIGIEAPIIDIMKKLETVVVKYMNNEQKALTESK